MLFLTHVAPLQKKALSSWDSAFFLLIAGKVDLFQGNEVGLMFEFVLEKTARKTGMPM